MVTLSRSSKLEQSAVKLKTSISIGLTQIKTEPNIGLEFQPYNAAGIYWQHTKVHYMIKYVDTVKQFDYKC